MTDEQKVLIVLVLCCLVVLVIFLIYIGTKKNKSIEGFVNNPTSNPTSNPINKCVELSLTGLLANPMIDRNSSNVMINPSSKGNVVIGSPGVGCWTSLTDITNAYMVINLKKMTRVSYIITQGLKYFKVYFSKTDNNNSSYEEILYKDIEIVSNNNRIYFTAPNYDDVTKFNNLITSDGQSIFAKYIKIVPVKSDDSLITLTDKTNSNQDNINTIGSNGVKIEIMGSSNDSKIIQGGDSLMGSSKLYNINGDALTDINWTAETGNRDPRLRIVFEENGIVIPKTIYSIIYSSSDKSNSSEQWVQEFSITYSHNKSKVSDTIYNIKGNTNCGKNEFQYYFETPVIATELVIKPTLLNKSTKSAEMKIINIMGLQVSQVQEKVLLDKSKQKFCTSDSVDGCGSVSDLLGKQTEIQQLCDALELQDQIKENNQRIQKNRQYIMQLDEHDKKIANLEEVVDKMKHLKTLREKSTNDQMLDQKTKQSTIDTQLQTLVEERKKSQSQFNVKLNIQPNSLSHLENLVQTTENSKGINQGNDTETTPLEAFTNYNSNSNSLNNIPQDPFNNRWLEHKFKLKMDENTSQGFIKPTYLERQFEQTMNKGFNYNVYQDNTFKNQLNNVNNVNNVKVFKKDNTFLEEKLLDNSPTSTLDHNVKFVKQMM